jgi:hypothetical protein
LFGDCGSKNDILLILPQLTDLESPMFFRPRSSSGGLRLTSTSITREFLPPLLSPLCPLVLLPLPAVGVAAGAASNLSLLTRLSGLLTPFLPPMMSGKLVSLSLLLLTLFRDVERFVTLQKPQAQLFKIVPKRKELSM